MDAPLSVSVAVGCIFVCTQHNEVVVTIRIVVRFP
jgi:hypothetical protein